MSLPHGGSQVAPALADFLLLNEEVAALVRARLPLETHLARLGKELPKRSADLCGRIGDRMEHGENFVSAMEAECATLPAAYRAVIAAGVESGELGPAVESLVDSATQMSELRRVTGIAILYPLVIIVEVCLLLALTLGQFAIRPDVWRETSTGLLSKFAQWPWAVPLFAMIVPGFILLTAAVWWWRSGRIGGVSSTRLGSLATLPWARRIYYWGQASSLADLLRLLVERGIPLERALVLAGDAAGVKQFRQAAHEIAAKLRRGEVQSLTSSLTDDTSRGLPPLVRLAVARADDRNALTSGLRQASQIYHDRAARNAEWYAQYVPMLLTLVIGGTLSIGFTLLILSPYANILHELARWHSR